MTEPAYHQITEDDAGSRLDRWLKRERPELPHGLVQNLLRRGRVRVNGSKVEGAYRLNVWDVVSVPHLDAEAAVTLPADARAGSSPRSPLGSSPRSAPRPPRPTPRAPAPLSEADAHAVRDMILHEDRRVLALNKPAGLAAQGGSKVRRSADALLASAYPDAPPKLVHRLDKETSGVLLMAKEAATARALAGAFAGNAGSGRSAGRSEGRPGQRLIRKLYWALVVGTPPEEGIIEDVIAKTGPEGQERMRGVDGGQKSGSRAVTRYRVVERLGKRFSWMALEPITGRTHQLRVHMAERGCPIVGDFKYGGEAAHVDGIPRGMYLHARKLHLQPEVLGYTLDLTAPLTGEMAAGFRDLGLTAAETDADWWWEKA